MQNTDLHVINANEVDYLLYHLFFFPRMLLQEKLLVGRLSTHCPMLVGLQITQKDR